jgi:histidinol-phosphate/aromatic aminotransferase/cobyric acid decarboxylase-like protein
LGDVGVPATVDWGRVIALLTHTLSLSLTAVAIEVAHLALPLHHLRRYSVVAVPRLGAPHFQVSIPGIASAVAAGARLVFVASPNNPTGALLTDSEIEALCSLEAIVVVDEAYIEFAGLHRSATRFLGRFPNLVVMRTFSKWAGLAGLRVGYMVGHPKLVERAKAIKQPYNVTVLSDIGAQAAIKVRSLGRGGAWDDEGGCGAEGRGGLSLPRGQSSTP